MIVFQPLALSSARAVSQAFPHRAGFSGEARAGAFDFRANRNWPDPSTFLDRSSRALGPAPPANGARWPPCSRNNPRSQSLVQDLGDSQWADDSSRWGACAYGRPPPSHPLWAHGPGAGWHSARGDQPETRRRADPRPPRPVRGSSLGLGRSQPGRLAHPVSTSLSEERRAHPDAMISWWNHHFSPTWSIALKRSQGRAGRHGLGTLSCAETIAMTKSDHVLRIAVCHLPVLFV